MKRSVRLLGLSVLVACGGGKATLDASDVQAKVGTEAAKRVGVPVASTQCPSSIKPATGSTFSCTVTFQGGGALQFKVDQVDAAGSLAIAPVGDWVLGDRMEKDLVTEMFLIGHPDATIDCGNAVVPVTLPAQVTCSVKTPGSGPAQVQVAIDAHRNVDWKLAGTL